MLEFLIGLIVAAFCVTMIGAIMSTSGWHEENGVSLYGGAITIFQGVIILIISLVTLCRLQTLSYGFTSWIQDAECKDYGTIRLEKKDENELNQ